MPSSTTPLSFEVPAKRNPHKYLHILYIFRNKSQWLHFCRCIYGSIFIQICAVGSKRRIFSAPESTRVRFGHSRSFRVIQGRWFWYQSKVRMRLPISRSLWLWSYLARFLIYGDLLAKNCLFFLPLSHSAPSLPMFPLEFCGEVNHEESWGYPTVKTAWS